MNDLKKIERELQSKIKKNGEKWEHKMLSMSSSKWEDCKLHLDDLETTKIWNCDLVNHKDKIFLELTTSAQDGKESKVIVESKVYKYHYPDYKFVVGVKELPKGNIRKSDGLNSIIDHFKQTSTIDQVLVGEEEVLKFMSKPFFNKQITINNKTKGVIPMTSNILIMDTLLHGASKNDVNGVTKLAEIMSAGKVKSSTQSTGGSDAAKKKRQYFESSALKPSENTEPTSSIREILTEWGQIESSGDVSRFFSSKEATKMMNKKVKMIDMGEGYIPDRYHFKKSDVQSN